MSYLKINDHLLYVETEGSGEPVVAVHGSWTNGAVWGAVAETLRASFRFTAYDRLGSSRSERPDTVYTRRRHEDDLAALIEDLGAPVHLVASSYGGVIALSLAARRPELVRSVLVHEPAVFALAPTPAVEAAWSSIQTVVERIERGDHEGGARQFVEEVALGPGGWEMLPQVFRDAAAHNAPTFAREARDPEIGTLDTDALARYPGRVVITRGSASLGWFADVTDAAVAASPHAEEVTIPGAGHSPHSTHPAEYAAILAELLGGVRATAA
jgi:pimeloyl-ACP methyl ester carboxylesterase